MAWLKMHSVSVAMFAVVVCLGIAVALLQRSNNQLHRDNALLVQERDQARFILANQQRAMTLFSTIAQAVNDEKQQNLLRSDAVRTQVRADLEKEPAARERVPRAVTERVWDAAREIRAGATGSHP